MTITLVTPAAAGSLAGNRTTADRWRRLIDQLGHETLIKTSWDGEQTDLLIALHGRKSFGSIQRYRKARPKAPLVVALTGTDLYRDLERGDEVRQALEMADRIVVLQPLARDRLPAELHDKVHVIVQSAVPSVSPSTVQTALPASNSSAVFQVCVLSHLRAIKDPLLTAAATHHLPAASRIAVVHAGAAHDDELGAHAQKETETNPRYRWIGPLPVADARELLARSRLLVLSSHDEGGANVVSEAIVARVPVLSTSIPGSVGLLGADYPGYYPVGDARALAELMSRAESDGGYYARLSEHCERLRPQFTPERERAAWRELLDGMSEALQEPRNLPSSRDTNH